MLFNQIQGGGLDIQGVTDPYKVKSGNIISAGDFVSLDVGDSLNFGAATQVSGAASYASQFIKLSSSRSLFVYLDGANLKAVIITVSGLSLSFGSSVVLCSAGGGEPQLKAVMLSDTKVFVLHVSPYPYALYGIVITVSGDTISVGNNTLISNRTVDYLYPYISVEKIHGTEKAVVMYTYGSGGSPANLYARIVTVSGLGFSMGTETMILGSTYYQGWGWNTQVLPTTSTTSTTRIFASHQHYDGGSQTLYGCVLVVDSAYNFGIYSDTQLSGMNNSDQENHAVLLPSGKILISHTGTDYFYLYATLVSVSDSNVFTSNPSLLLYNATRCDKNAISLLNNTTGLVVFSGNEDGYMLKGIEVCESGSTITGSNFTHISTDTNSGTYLALGRFKDNMGFIVKSGVSSVAMVEMFSKLSVTQFVSKVDGVAKTGGTSGQYINVITPTI